MLLIIGKVHLCVFSVLLLEIFFLQNSFSSDLCVCVTKCTNMEKMGENAKTRLKNRFEGMTVR